MLGIQIFSAEGIAVKASLSLVFETIAPLQAALGVSRAQTENLLGLHLYFTPELSVQTAVVLLEALVVETVDLSRQVFAPLLVEAHTLFQLLNVVLEVSIII